MADLQELVKAMIAVGISIVLGMYVFLSVFANIPFTGTETATENATRAAVRTLFFAGIGLLALVEIILAAKAIQMLI